MYEKQIYDSYVYNVSFILIFACRQYTIKSKITNTLNCEV